MPACEPPESEKGLNVVERVGCDGKLKVRQVTVTCKLPSHKFTAMASTQTQPSLDVAMRTSFTMDRFSGSGRTDSTIDDSPFGSALNTPLDEDVREPFEAIGKKLEELQTHRDAHNMDLKGEIVPPEQAIDEDSERQELSLISSSRPDHLQEKISQVIQSQENEQTSSHKSTTSLLSADDISHVAAEDNFDSSSVNSFDTSAISDRLLASFPTVPFSSPEVPNDQVMFNSPVPFTTELSRSLYNIQTQSLESSPALNLNNQNNISPDGSPVFFSPEIDQGFSVHTRESSLYNLPNAPITISPSIAVAQSECSYYSEIEVRDI
ncbi:hypothetical protein J3R30DRAFT_2083433 [Lentinula aciculospora]|uniref:Uncharacterized protein n=1 Tax=Lentinula aciculospora TaxID=153920 RepID=A0A9W8ZVQ8_9AGAR|nr:hypothetical protein J3R30DRAFT_2083433 [Lentinula aciculospora]